MYSRWLFLAYNNWLGYGIWQSLINWSHTSICDKKNVSISSDKTILIFLWEGFHIYLSKSKNQFIITIIIIIIIIMNVIGLGLWVLSYVIYSLSYVPLLTILDGLCPLFHGVETVVLVLVSGCFPLYLRVEVNLFSSFWSHPLYFPSFRLVSPRSGIRKRICAAIICFCSYEGWNFNSGNYLRVFTTDTK